LLSPNYFIHLYFTLWKVYLSSSIKQKISPPASPSLMKKRGNKEKRDKAPLKYSLRWRGVIASNARQQNPARTGEARQNHQQYIGKLPRAGGQGNKS